MAKPLSFMRVFFLFLCILFSATYTINIWPGEVGLPSLATGLAGGVVFGMALIGSELFFKRFSLRSLNTAILGLFCGYLLGEAVVMIYDSALNISSIPITTETAALLRAGIFLSTVYLGLILAARGADELYVSIPFIKFKPDAQKKKDVLLDSSVLLDTRLIDLCASGLLDQQAVIPRFILKELSSCSESSDEQSKAKARKISEVVKKLENIPHLELRYQDTDFPDLKDSMSKLIRLARMSDAYIMTADMPRVQQSMIEGIRVINLHCLSNALKPITQNGEYLNIKIQRYGKEPRQGVGYLEDGTMVVVNGGAEFIGETIKAQVLSVKHTSSGRMVFCNAPDEGFEGEHAIASSVNEMECAHKNYFAL